MYLTLASLDTRPQPDLKKIYHRYFFEIGLGSGIQDIPYPSLDQNEFYLFGTLPSVQLDQETMHALPVHYLPGIQTKKLCICYIYGTYIYVVYRQTNHTDTILSW